MCPTLTLRQQTHVLSATHMYFVTLRPAMRVVHGHYCHRYCCRVVMETSYDRMVKVRGGAWGRDTCNGITVDRATTKPGRFSVISGLPSV